LLGPSGFRKQVAITLAASAVALNAAEALAEASG